MSANPVDVIKGSLLNDAFKKYNDLVGFLKSLPIDQNIEGLKFSHLHIDTAMLWIKEILMTAPLILQQQPAPAQDAPAASEATLDVAEPAV